MSEPVDRRFGAARAKRLERGWLATWRPIKTAPKDGRWVLVFAPSGQRVSKWINGDEKNEGFWFGEVYKFKDTIPTHWMPLPANPEGVK